MKSKIWSEAERVGLVAGTYLGSELTEDQLELLKKVGIKMYAGDTLVLTYDNLEWLEYQAEKRGIIHG